MIFGTFLKTYRQQNNLTQKEFCDELAEFSPLFSSLSPITLSRWENGAIRPSFARKRQIMTFFSHRRCLDDPVCYDMVRSRFQQLAEPLSSAFEHNYKTLVGNLPKLKIPLRQYETKRLRHDSDPAIFEMIHAIEKASETEGYYDVDIDRLRRWCRHPDTFAVACRYKQQHLGHFIMLKVRNSVADALVHAKRHEHGIDEKDLCPEGENGTYYINALFGSNPTVAALLNTQAYLHMLEHRRVIDDVVIFSTRRDGVRITRSYGIEIVDSGVHETYGFRWHGMRSPVEDILFSDLVLKLIF